jgi:hypothetical protein
LRVFALILRLSCPILSFLTGWSFPMKFEPTRFIELAARDGVELTRMGKNIRVNNAPPHWVAAIKKHKRRLLRHLPPDGLTSLQADLFEEISLDK